MRRFYFKAQTLFYSQKVLEAAQALNNADLLVLASWTRGRLLLNIGEFTKANVLLIQTLPLLQKANKESDWVQGLIYYGWGLAATGHYTEAPAQLEQARICCLQTNNLFYLPLHYLILGLVHHFGGNLTGALEASQAAVKIGIQYGDHLSICHATSFRSLCESYLGQHQAAAARVLAESRPVTVKLNKSRGS